MFICPRTSLLRLPFLMIFRFVISSGFLALNSSHVAVLLTLLFSRLCMKQCQQSIHEIGSVNILDKIAVPLLFRCSFRCSYFLVADLFKISLNAQSFQVSVYLCYFLPMSIISYGNTGHCYTTRVRV